MNQRRLQKRFQKEIKAMLPAETEPLFTPIPNHSTDELTDEEYNLAVAAIGGLSLCEDDESVRQLQIS